MRKERERRTLETAGMLFTLLFGNLLHFVYDWTGQAGWAAYLSAVNESTWEHMKLSAVPWLVWTVVTIVANRCAASALPRAIGLLAGLAARPSPVCGPHKRHPRHTAKNAVIPTVCS